MSQKRVIFSEEEKVIVRRLALENKHIVESKKSDAVTVIAKKQCWEKITEEFNCNGQHPARTSSQLRKLWENIKTRRRTKLSAEKRDLMKTGGGPHTPDVPPDPELDGVGIDIEMQDAIDSDTLASSTKYAVVEGELVPIEDEGDESVCDDIIEVDSVVTVADNSQQESREVQETQADSQPSTSQAHVDTTPSSRVQLKKGSKNNKEEDVLRLRRNQQLVEQGQDIHEIRMREARLRTTLLEQELRQGQEMFKVKMENLLLEQGNNLKVEKEFLENKKQSTD